MKKVLVIGSRNSGKKNDPIAIAEALAQSGSITTQIVFWEDMVFEIAPNSVEVSVEGRSIFDASYDVVLSLGWYKNGKQSYYRDVAYALALILKHRKIEFWNSEMAQQRSTTKLSAMVQLALAGVSVPATYFSIDFEKVKNKMNYPYIAKAIAASRGKSNFLVKDAALVHEVTLADTPMLIQEYLENTHDLRVICFGGQPKLVLRRARAEGAETHLNNTSQGGIAEWIPIEGVDQGLLTNAEKISKIMNREMAGIDFIPDIHSPIGYSCLEVNAIPQLTSGTDVDVKLAALIETIETLN